MSNKTDLQTLNTDYAALIETLRGKAVGGGGGASGMNLLASGTVNGLGESIMTIPHSCGVVPNAVFMNYALGSAAYTVKGVFLVRMQDGSYSGLCAGFGGNTSSISMTFPSSAANGAVIWDESSVVLDLSKIMGTSYKFHNTNYTWRVYV